jgi:hypothetical protein
MKSIANGFAFFISKPLTDPSQFQGAHAHGFLRARADEYRLMRPHALYGCV